MGLRGEVEAGGRESVYRTLNKVTKLIIVLRETCFGGRGRGLNVGLRGEAKGGGSSGGRRRREGGWGIYRPLKVTKLVIVLGQSWGEGVSGDRRV